MTECQSPILGVGCVGSAFCAVRLLRVFEGTNYHCSVCSNGDERWLDTVQERHVGLNKDIPHTLSLFINGKTDK